MEKKEVLGILSIIFLGSILFVPTDSGAWKWFLILGIAFGIGWFKAK